MIKHVIYFNNEEFNLFWKLELPFRLCKGDKIYKELLYKKGEIWFDQEHVIKSERWIKLTTEYEYFEVENIDIDEDIVICAWVKPSNADNVKS